MAKAQMVLHGDSYELWKLEGLNRWIQGTYIGAGVAGGIVLSTTLPCGALRIPVGNVTESLVSRIDIFTN